MKLAYFTVSILLLWCAGSWAYIFSQIYATGVLLIEPNRAWLLAEFALATTITLAGLLAVIHSFDRLRGRD